MDIKRLWISFWTWVKAKVAGVIYSDEASLRRSVQQHILDLSPEFQTRMEAEFDRFTKIIRLAKPTEENSVQECDATMLNSSNLPEPKSLSTLAPHNKNNNNMFTKLRADFESLLTKIGIVSHRLLGYIAIAISFGYNLLSALASPIGQIAIKDLIPAGTDATLVEDFVAGIVKAIAYLTDSQAILSAPTPDAMLTLFLQDLQKEVPGAQKSKIFTFISQIVGFLDGNTKIDSVYNWLVSKYFLLDKIKTTGTASTIVPIPATSVAAAA